MCRLRNIAMRDYQESVTIGQTDTHTHRQTPDKVIPMCRYASQATQKLSLKETNLHVTLTFLCICFLLVHWTGLVPHFFYVIDDTMLTQKICNLWSRITI